MTDAAPILIAGPTASGKSALALALAERLDGTIINADSMQVYRELRVITARPSLEDEARVPHALYGFVPAREAYSAGRFVPDAAAAIAAARAAGRRPIIAGGTGLYFKALLEGLSPIPPVGEDVRAHWRAEAERLGAHALHATLAARDPAMAAQLMPADTQRIVRALEVLESSGRSLSDWQCQPGMPVVEPERAVKLFIDIPRDELHARADARFDQIIARGGLDEASALAALNLDPALPVMRALGVAPLMACATGEMSRVDAIERSKAETRQYIKRQKTWLNKHMIAWKRVLEQQTESNIEEIIAFIQS